jgi:hypothetical protein
MYDRPSTPDSYALSAPTSPITIADSKNAQQCANNAKYYLRIVAQCCMFPDKTCLTQEAICSLLPPATK